MIPSQSHRLHGGLAVHARIYLVPRPAAIARTSSGDPHRGQKSCSCRGRPLSAASWQAAQCRTPGMAATRCFGIGFAQQTHRGPPGHDPLSSRALAVVSPIRPHPGQVNWPAVARKTSYKTANSGCPRCRSLPALQSQAVISSGPHASRHRQPGQRNSKYRTGPDIRVFAFRAVGETAARGGDGGRDA
jgi:hypothetical protein